MYSSLLTEDTYKRADLIYKSISEEFNPHLREFVNCSKNHEKNVIETGRTFRFCHEAAVKIGISASSSPGCNDVGKSIMGIADTLQEVNMLREEWLQSFRTKAIIPMERRIEQDSKYIVALRKKSQEEFKTRNGEAEKAIQNVAKLKKKILTKSLNEKNEIKLEKASEKLISSKASAEMMAHEMLNRAFSEERRRYCFFVEKQCDTMEAWIQYYLSCADILQANLEKWRSVSSSSKDLLPGAVALIESSLPRRTNVSLDELDMERIEMYGQDINGQYRVAPTKAVRSDIKRFASTRAVGSPKEVISPYATGPRMMLTTQEPIKYIRSKTPDFVITHDEELNIEGRQEDSKDVTPRSTRSSINLGNLFNNRYSTTSSEIQNKSNRSECSEEIASSDEQQQVTAIQTENLRNSFSDSGISVEVWSSDHDSDTIKRAKNTPSPTKQTESEPEAEVVAGEKVESAPVIAIHEICCEALYEFAPDPGSTKLSMARGDTIHVLMKEEKGGWMYGENKRLRERGWFPVYYTNMGKAQNPQKNKQAPSLGSIISGTTAPTPVNIMPLSPGQESPRPVVKVKKSPAGTNVFQFAKDLENPFKEIQLKKTGKL